MKTMKVILICVTQFVFSIIHTEALQCLSCDHVAEARDCSHLETCGAHQECFVQRFIASNLKQYYKMGCKDSQICATDSNSLLMSAIGKKRDFTQADVTSHWHNKRSDTDLLLCLQCCNNVDGCNKDLCGSAPTTSRRCLNCDDVLGWKDCQEISECSTDQLCYVQTSAISVNYEIRVKMGCLGQLQCEGIKRAFPSRCVVCCNDADFCNYNACDNFTSTYRTSSTSTTSTTTTTTTTIPPTTTPEATIHVDGPPSPVTYGDKSSLTCITSPPAASYAWTYETDANLPAGVQSNNHGSTSGGFVGLNVLSVSAVDKITVGEYTCKAKYPDGHTDTFTYNLQAAPVKPSVALTKGPVRSNFVLRCNITGYPQPLVSWNFNGDASQTTLPTDVALANDSTSYTLFVFTYDPSKHNGLWSCSASNSAGVVSSAVRVP